MGSAVTEIRVVGRPHAVMQRLTTMLAAPAEVISAAVTTNTSARRLKLWVKRRMWEYPRTVRGKGPKRSTSTTRPGAFGKGAL